MKIISYNVNGIRAALKKGLVEWLASENADVLCIQESKAHEEQIDPTLFEEIGYKHHYWHAAEKKGYSGVSTFSKLKAASVVYGMGNPKYDIEGRVLLTVINDYKIYNCYFPSGSSGETRHQFKIEFLEDFFLFMIHQNPLNKTIVLGDYNIVHQEIDIHNPQRKDKPSGYRPEERAWLDKWFDKYFIDSFRLKHPNKQEFSWWSYRAGARARNKGWRIDYISVSKDLQKQIDYCEHRETARHSDHCPVILKIN